MRLKECLCIGLSGEIPTVSVAKCERVVLTPVHTATTTKAAHRITDRNSRAMSVSPLRS